MAIQIATIFETFRARDKLNDEFRGDQPVAPTFLHAYFAFFAANFRYAFTPDAINAGIGNSTTSPFVYFSSSPRMASRILFNTVGF